MDSHLNRVFELIKQEMNKVHYRWKLYRQMFGTNSSRIELINRTSSNVFVEFQWLVIDYMVMSLSKLTDRARMSGNDNLSFPLLIELVRKSSNENLASKLDQDLSYLQDACKKFRQIRDKRVAHNDLVVALEDNASPLPGVSRADIEAALEHARNILNKIELHYLGSQTLYQELILPLTNDGRSVLIWLQKGLAYEQLEDGGLIERGEWRKLGNID